MRSAKFFLLLVFAISAASVIAQQRPRYVAVTVDDLPVVSTRNDVKTRRKVTRDLLTQIKRAKVPAVGFVNENKLYTNGKRDEAQVDLLRQWLEADLELGNHTFSHLGLHDATLADYEADILKGEIITKELLEKAKKRPRYFRHPYLWTGLDLQTKKQLGEFLSEHGYTIAPVTIDNSDWIFARAYDNAFDKKDKKLMQQVAAAYVPYLEAKFDYWERQSDKLFGREIKQVLLLHANFINSKYFGDIARMLKGRGYRFITLEDALTDNAYALPDTFTRRSGISWLHRWALAKGRENVLPNEPMTPEFVKKAAGVTEE